jgi:capsular exopolysaccharide synthesis family protein
MNEQSFTTTGHSHLRDYLDVLVRRRWPALAVFIVVVASVSIYSVLATKKYTASTQVLIEQSSSRALSFQEALTFDSSQQDFYQTQYKIISSRAIAEAVIRKLELWRSAEFIGEKKFIEIKDTEPAGEKLDELVRKAADRFIDKVAVEPIRQSRLVYIHFTSYDPEVAANCANYIVQAYIDNGLERRLRVTQMTVNFLGKRIEEQRRKLEASQLALQKYMEEQKLANVISDQYSDISAMKIAELNQQLVQATAFRKEAQARYQLAREAQKDMNRAQGLVEAQSNPQIQAIRRQQLETSNKMAELSQRYGPNHPRITALRAELNALERDLHNENSKILMLLSNQFEVALAKEKALEEALEKQKEDAMDIRKKSIGFQVLKREVDTNQSLYSMLLSKAKEARVTEEIDVGSVTVVDPALVPEKPSSPRLVLNVLLAIVGGALVGVSLAFLLEYMDNTIKFPEDLAKASQVAFLAHIPYYEMANTDTDKAPVTRGYGGSSGSQVVAEAFRNLRTTLTLSRAEKPPRVLSVTSALSSEGKSFVSAKLAISFASAGERTLLIDADMRKPTQHRLWSASRKSGLSSLLSGTANMEETIQRGVMTNLDLITSGPIPPNPAELLQSGLMAQLLAIFAKHYHRVVIDCPPILPVTDASILAHLSDGTVLVVAAGSTTTYALKQAADRLFTANVQILGAILNLTASKRTDYYYKGYRYKYYSQYEYGGKIEDGRPRRNVSDRARAEAGAGGRPS